MTSPPWTALPAGILIASLASAVGIGGGVMWMPFLLLALNIPPETAVLTSLLIQTAGMGSGSVAFYSQGLGDFRLALLFLSVALPGILAGAFLTSRLSPQGIELFLGILIMTTALLFVSSNQRYLDLGTSRVDMKKAVRYSWVTVLASLITGMLSISMSEWLIPLMRSRLDLKMSHAVATCISIAFGTCVIGSAIHLLMGTGADWRAVVWGVPGVIIGGQIGPRLTRRINDRKLKEIFIFLLTLVGIHLVYNAY